LTAELYRGGQWMEKKEEYKESRRMRRTWKGRD
jgi:hypothetical protein